MGPFDQQIAWNTSSMVGSRRFIERVWKLGEKVEALSTEDSRGRGPVRAERVPQPAEKTAVLRALHKSIKKVSDDIEGLRFNTAISTLMITMNELEKAPTISREEYEIVLKLLAPFAPHVTEELWSNLGNKGSIHASPWPLFNAHLATDSELTIMVQINGKVRGSFTAAAETGDNDLKNMAQNIDGIDKWLSGKNIVKVIVVKGRLVNIVVS